MARAAAAKVPGVGAARRKPSQKPAKAGTLAEVFAGDAPRDTLKGRVAFRVEEEVELMLEKLAKSHRRKVSDVARLLLIDAAKRAICDGVLPVAE